MRILLSGQGYTQPYGTSDVEIRQQLGITGKCADFVGYHPELARWRIAESKGSDMDAAYYQLINTAAGLIARVSRAGGKIDLRIYTSPQNYFRMLKNPRGLSGNRLRNGFLGNYVNDQVWRYAEIKGVRISVDKCNRGARPMNSRHDPQSSKLPTKVWSALWKEALSTDGRSDAFAFALECDGDLPQLHDKLQEIEEMMADPAMLKGPLAPGNGPRIYRDGYLAGLKEAIAILSAAVIKEKQAV